MKPSIALIGIFVFYLGTILERFTVAGFIASKAPNN